MKQSENLKTRNLVNEAREYALSLVKRDALALMKRYPKYTRFYLAMGVWFFVDLQNENISDAPCMNNLADFIGDWDSILKITGEGIYINADGSICDKW